MSTAVVTIVFTDLVGSTELAGALGEDAAEQLRREHFQVLRDAIAEHGGEEVKTIGDSLMVAFTSPAEAVACAVSMQQGIDGHNRSGKQPLAIRIGINSGEATVEDGDYFGTPVVVAKRLCDVAEGAQILCSDLVHALAGTRGGFTFKDLGALPLKGIDDPIPACEVAWEPSGGALPLPASIAARDASPFVGRTEERASLDRALAAARDGRRTLAMLAGEPGIGKTRTSFEFARAAHAGGAIVLYGRCDEEGLLPYQPFVEALRFYAGTADPDQLAGQLGPTGGDLARLVPDLPARVPGMPAPIEADPETERYRLFDAVGHLLAEASGGAPTLLILDDLHWADAPTLALLKHVLRWPADSRLLILGTYRDVELDRRHPLADVLADLRRDKRYHRVVLRGLSKDEVRAVLRARAGHELPPEAERLADAIHAQTEGNPFFIREVIRHLVETGAIYQKDGRWTSDTTVEQFGLPEGIREVVGRRLARLSDDCNRALRVAAVIGRSFDLSVLERAADVAGADLLDPLQEAVDARVVEEVPEAIDRYTFTHALIRETLSEELTTSRRVRLHARVGEILEDLYPNEPPFAELAYHFHEAASITGNDLKCVTYSRRAGDKALELAAYEEAADHYGRGLEMLDEMNQPAERDRVGLLRARGEAERLTAAGAAARATLLEAFERARALEDPEELARAALGFAGQWPEVALVDEQVLGALTEALEALPSGDHPLRARLHARIAIETIFTADPTEALGHAQEGSEMARRLGEPATLAYALTARAHSASAPEGHARTRAIGEEAVAVAAEAGEHEVEQRVRALLLVSYLVGGEGRAYETERERFIALNDTLRLPFYRYVEDMMETERALRHGEMGPDLRGRIERVGETARTLGRASGALAHASQFWLWAMGRPDDVPIAAQRVRDVFGPLSEIVPTLGVFGAGALTWLGQSDGVTMYRRCIDAHLSVPPTHWGYLTGDFRAPILIADRGLLERLYAHYEPFHAFHGCGGPTTPTVYGYPVATSLGAIATALGRTDAGIAHLEEALDRAAAVHAVVGTVMTRLELVRSLLARDAPGDRDRARREVDAAVEAAERHDLPLYLQEARALRPTI